MRIHDLRPAEGSVKEKKRIGRGRASGHGKTSGRGQKGQLSRSGGGKGPGFEGGQNPLQRRLPKLPGFKNRFKKLFSVVNVVQLEERFEDGSVVEPAALAARGLIKKADLPVKILGNGELKKKLTVKAAAFTATARQKIEAAGGLAETIESRNSNKKSQKA
ncbi:MAG: 50S ribosomal protein L15 [Actinomycetota bacterium]|nr:50S ribosomal protein L15 [Actinomycetota bacterium]